MYTDFNFSSQSYNDHTDRLDFNDIHKQAPVYAISKIRLINFV